MSSLHFFSCSNHLYRSFVIEVTTSSYVPEPNGVLLPLFCVHHQTHHVVVVFYACTLVESDAFQQGI